MTEIQNLAREEKEAVVDEDNISAADETEDTRQEPSEEDEGEPRGGTPEVEVRRRRRSHVQPENPLRRKVMFLACFIIAVWLAYSVQAHRARKAKLKSTIIYASRYSKEHKFRPAASPIITETLKDGRIRLRGATPPPPEPTQTTKPKKRRNRKRKGSKKSGKKKNMAGT